MESVDATATTTLAGTFNGGESLKRGPRVFEATRPLTFSVNPSADDTLYVTMNPVLDKNEVYTAYEAFAKTPGAILVGKPGPSDPVHVGKLWEDNQYYWIPKSFSEEYFQLALRTIVKRGPVGGHEATPPSPSSKAKPKTSRSLRDALKSPDVSPENPRSTPEKELKDAVKELRQFKGL